MESWNSMFEQEGERHDTQIDRGKRDNGMIGDV